MTSDAAFWNRIAERYARKPVKDPTAFDRKIAHTRAQIRPDHVLLDIGCGTGSLALRLSPHAAKVHGLDVSAEMIRIARAKARDQGVANVEFHVGPFDKDFNRFEPESLDGICAYSVLHLLAERPPALAHIFRLLKPGGFFVASTVCLKEGWLPYGPIVRVMRWLNQAPKVVHCISRRTVESEVREAGFTGVEEPNVGAEAIVSFLVAQKPGAA